MDLEEWDSDDDFESSVLEIESHEVKKDILTPYASCSKVTIEPIGQPSCSTPQDLLHPDTKTSIGRSLSLSTISNANSPCAEDVVSATQMFKNRTDVPVRRRRKFPGPAGALPKLRHDVDIRSLKDVNVDTQTDEERVQVTPSQSSQSLSVSTFLSWNRMVEELELNEEHLRKHCIANALKHASRRQLPDGKVPLLVTLVVAINKTLPDATVTLKDMTGNINGVIHRLLIKQHRDRLKVGSSLLLKQVSVFSPSRRRQYLNITPNNLLQVYSEKDQSTEVECTSVVKSLSLDTLLTQPVCCPPKTNSTGAPTTPLTHSTSGTLLQAIGANTSTPLRRHVNIPQTSTPLTERANTLHLNTHRLNVAVNIERDKPAVTNTSNVSILNSTGQDPLFDDDDLGDLELDF